MKSVSRWQEIDLDFFKEIFDLYWSGQFKDRVIEVANLTSYKISGDYNSIFFGYKISMCDYPKWNEVFIKSISNMEVEKNRLLSSCMLEKGPKISPLVYQEHYDLMMWAWFDGEVKPGFVTDELGKRCPFWYYKRGDNIIPSMSAFGIENTAPVNSKKKVLVRILSFDSWKELVNDYIDIGGYSEKWTGENYPDKSTIHLL